MDTYTINKINEDGSVNVTFSCDNKVQVISGLPITDKEALVAELSKYAVAYKSGLDTVVAVETPDPLAVGLVGKVQTVVVE